MCHRRSTPNRDPRGFAAGLPAHATLPARQRRPPGNSTARVNQRPDARTHITQPSSPRKHCRVARNRTRTTRLESRGAGIREASRARRLDPHRAVPVVDDVSRGLRRSCARRDPSESPGSLRVRSVLVPVGDALIQLKQVPVARTGSTLIRSAHERHGLSRGDRQLRVPTAATGPSPAYARRRCSRQLSEHGRRARGGSMDLYADA